MNSRALLASGLCALASAGCLTTINGVDGGDGCPPPVSFGPSDGGPLLMMLTACPRDGSVFVEARTGITVIDADGGVFDLDDCVWCSQCPSLSSCERTSSAPREITAGSYARMSEYFDGHGVSAESTCPTTGEKCSLRDPLPPQTVTMRFCISRQSPTTSPAPPLECTDVAVKVPFEVDGVEARFR